MHSSIPDLEYRCPTDLQVTPTPLRRAVIIGQCLISGWPGVLTTLHPEAECDFLLFNNAQELPPTPPHPVDEYDFQLVQIPLRSVVPDAGFFQPSYSDVKRYEVLFEESRERLAQFLAMAMRWNREHNLLSFVANFLLPQQNPMGRLLPRYDLRNFVYFVEKLNEALAEELRGYKNAYLFDFDQVVATHGRKHFQDDAVWQTNHNAALGDADFDKDQGRLEPAVKASALYPVQTYKYVQLGVLELLSMYRTVRQIDMVKLVVIDLDDTLWRGVAVERTEHSHEAIEGWPLGMAEALTHLRRRGVLLGVVSKNEETLVRPIWRKLFGDRLTYGDFAICKINWRTKVDNFQEILEEANLLPRNAVFIDDNPVERAAIKSAFPDVRVLGPRHLEWRRILLWSAETQLPIITNESAARTEMIQAQVEREGQRKRLSREEFLMTLNVEIEMTEITDTGHHSFPRALELINKSNQYNTTGRRWAEQELAAGFTTGTRLLVFDVKDRFTGYGLVCVVVVEGATIVQYVMSCRVVGMEVELAVVAAVLEDIHRVTGVVTAVAELEQTPLNLLARDLWSRCGFELYEDGRWRRPLEPALIVPPHINLTKATVPALFEFTAEPDVQLR